MLYNKAPKFQMKTKVPPKGKEIKVTKFHIARFKPCSLVPNQN